MVWLIIECFGPVEFSVTPSSMNFLTHLSHIPQSVLSLECIFCSMVLKQALSLLTSSKKPFFLFVG